MVVALDVIVPQGQLGALTDATETASDAMFRWFAARTFLQYIEGWPRDTHRSASGLHDVVTGSVSSHTLRMELENDWDYAVYVERRWYPWPGEAKPEQVAADVVRQAAGLTVPDVTLRAQQTQTRIARSRARDRLIANRTTATRPRVDGGRTVVGRRVRDAGFVPAARIRL